jgi:ABC-type dipeptide/oligopeptide/nickel transport system permease component
MLRFIGRRLLYIVLVYVLIVFFCHLGMRMIRNSELSRPNFDLAEQGRSAWRATRSTISDVLRGDLGSVRTERGPRPVREFVWEAYVNSMGLLLVALAGAGGLGLLIGCLAALAKRRIWVAPLLGLTILGISTPSFFAGLLLQVGELAYLRTFGRRLVSMAGFGWDLEHMLLPVLVLAARPLAYLTRATFVSLQQIMQEDYIRTAFSKGLSLTRTVIEHAIRNMAVPTMTAVGVSLRFALGTLPVVEFFFAWPGMGRSLLLAINNRQTPVVVALASALGLTFLLTNLALDILYRVADPRTRES